MNGQICPKVDKILSYLQFTNDNAVRQDITNLVCDTLISLNGMVRTGCCLNLASISGLTTVLFNKQRTNSHHLFLSVFKGANTLHLNIGPERLTSYWKGCLGYQRCLQHPSNAFNVISDSTQQWSLYCPATLPCQWVFNGDLEQPVDEMAVQTLHIFDHWSLQRDS